MTTATTADSIALELALPAEQGVLMRLLALAMDKVQRNRRRPKGKGRLHRV